MTAPTHADVPVWPKVLAVVRADGTAEVTVNGTSHPVTALNVNEARAAVLGLVRTQTAMPLGRPVRVETRDPQGQWQLIVHPDGHVQEAGDPDPNRKTRRPAAPDTTPTAGTGTPTAPADPLTGSLPAAPSEVQTDVLVEDEDEVDQQPVDDQSDDEPDAASAPDAANPAPSTQTASPPAAYLEPAAPSPDAAPGRGRGDGEPAGTDDEGPTLQDLLTRRPAPRPGPARMGWQATVRRLSGGLIKPAPGPQEKAHRSAVASVQRSLDGPKTVVVVNPKGGANKTTAALLIAATFGIHRGGYTLAWDNNETRGTLGWRANPARHTNTAVDLLRDLHRFTDTGTARVGDLDNYVRAQGSAQFDVLASDEDAAGAASIDAEAFDRLHTTLARFYRVMVIDTGNNMRATNWQAALAAAAQLVIVSTVREDTAQSAAWLIDGLRATGNGRAVRQAVTVLTAPSRTPDPELSQRLHNHFGQLTRTVLDVPHDPALVAGGPITYDALTPASREAWLRVSAAVVDGL